MKGPADYAKEGTEKQKGSEWAMLKALVAGAGFLGVIVGVPNAIALWLLFKIVFELPTIAKLLAAVWDVGMSALSWCLVMVFLVALARMAIRLRKGEKVRAGDVLEFEAFVVPAGMLGAPMAAASALSLLGLVWGPLGGVAQALANLVMLAGIWAPIEMALTDCDPIPAWQASVQFWKANPVGNLIAYVMTFVLALLQNKVVFGIGAWACALVGYYSETKAALAAAVAAAPAVAPAAAPAPAPAVAGAGAPAAPPASTTPTAKP
jgi:hypothetical protein